MPELPRCMAVVVAVLKPVKIESSVLLHEKLQGSLTTSAASLVPLGSTVWSHSSGSWARLSYRVMSLDHIPVCRNLTY